MEKRPRNTHLAQPIVQFHPGPLIKNLYLHHLFELTFANPHLLLIVLLSLHMKSFLQETNQIIWSARAIKHYHINKNIPENIFVQRAYTNVSGSARFLKYFWQNGYLDLHFFVVITTKWKQM